MSSFSGRIHELPGISVDNFEMIGKRAYFLSHAHTDHTHGLYRYGNSKFAKYLCKNEVLIYMSEVTAKIFEYEFCDLASFVKPLKFGERQLISLPATEDFLEELHFDVTLIPAGHCLGSAMLLFQTNKKTVLYTGDFRYTENDVEKIRDLHNLKNRTEPIHIDAMYVDTTFIGLHHEDFPRRSDSVEYLLREIKAWLSRGPEYKVALDTPAKYGYEFVFNEIYKKLGKKVHVTELKWTLYGQMSDVLPGVTNDSTAIDIHNCPFNQNQHKNCEIGIVDKYIFMTVRLSAYKWRNFDIDMIPVEKTENRISVCYSAHCSRNELLYFIHYFSPKKVVGFPNEYKANMSPKKQFENVVLSPVKRRKIKL